MERRKGFTLIELLTVILIIGVLTSVALPQYKRAIQKARATEAIAMLRVIYDSSERLADQLGYRNYSALFTSEPSEAYFNRMDMFDSETIKCNIGDTVMTCEHFTYTLGGTYIDAASNKAGSTLMFRLYPSNPPVLKCRASSEEECDLYNLDFESAS